MLNAIEKILTRSSNDRTSIKNRLEKWKSKIKVMLMLYWNGWSNKSRKNHERTWRYCFLKLGFSEFIQANRNTKIKK